MKPYLFSAVFLLLWTAVNSQICPIAECRCEASQSNPPQRLINCRDKQLTQIPNIAYSAETFYELTFSTSQDPTSCSGCNKITSIPENAFSNLTIKRLDLSKNFIGQYSNGAFRGLEASLTDLILYGNGNNRPPFTAMQNLTLLTYLHLEKFDQGQFETSNSFGDFPNLQTLKLKTLKLQYIASGSFQNKLQKLKRLEIVDNPMFLTMPVGALRQLPTLEHLSLIQGGFSKVSSFAFERLGNLIDLDLSHNVITTLETGCFDGIHQKLEYLGLHLNQLNDTNLVPLAQGNWSNLHQINLAHNQIKNIPSNLFKNMKMLAYLNLDSNQISTISSTIFQELRNMHSMDLASNRITTIEKGAFANLQQLRVLDITSQSDLIPNNVLNLTRESVQGLEGTLTYLKLENTHLDESTVWDAIKSLTSLTHLDMTQTRLNAIQDLVFANHRFITDLEFEGYIDNPNHINRNTISQVSQKTFHGLENSLQRVHLAHNSIQEIDECVFKNFSKLQEITLRSNPLKCDCYLLWLYNWMKEIQMTNPTISMFVQAVCQTPTSLQNRELISLSRNDFCNGVFTPPVCEDLTVTTTTPAPSTTTLSTTKSAVVLPTLLFTTASSTTDTIQLTWSVVGDKSYIATYTVTYEKLGTASNQKSITIDRDKTSYPLTGLDSGSQYEVCIFALYINGHPSSVPRCEAESTKKDTSSTLAPAPQDDGLHPGIIAGIAIAVVIVILVIIAFIYILLRTNQRQKRPTPPPPVIEATSFAPVGTPRTGYDSKRFSKPKKNVEQNGKGLQVNVISNGKTDEPNRVSAGSYQFLNENQRLSREQMPSSSKMGGANGTSHDIKPARTSKGKYVNEPETPPPSYNNLYHNEPVPSQSPDHYINNLDARPLPKKPHSYENSSSGFLNHGFSPEFSNDPQHYIEVKDTMI